MPEPALSVRVVVEHGDLAQADADVIALKHASEALFGVEEAIDRRLGGLLAAAYGDSDQPAYRPGRSVLVPSEAITSPKVLAVGVGSLYALTYQKIDLLARHTIRALAHGLPNAQSLATTIHGPGIGLDPAECLRVQLLGFASEIRRHKGSLGLRRVVIRDKGKQRAESLSDSLHSLARDYPEVFVEDEGGGLLIDMGISGELERVRYESLREPTVFVAMPFSDSFRNVYDYGIRLPILAVRRKPIRIDEEQFVGSIVSRIKDQIRDSELVVADMTGANPNVFFEVGYAEGVGVPVVLLSQSTEGMPFDTRGDAHIIYQPQNIRQLEEQLTARLEALCSMSAT